MKLRTIQQPSKYQKAIYKVFQLTRRNISISAVAGAGKTTVLLELLKYVPEGERSLFLAFNNSIVDELRTRNTRRDATIMTIHSCGWQAILRRYGGHVRMNPNKGIAKTEQAIRALGADERKRGYYFYIVPQILDLMRCNLCPNDEESITRLLLHYDINADPTDIKVARRAFEYMTADRSQFDFMDMIYVPVTDASVRLQKYDIVFCDESQDFSIAQQEFIKSTLSRRGRLITVGDPHQAIYGFAGADADSYERLSTLCGASVKMPLSVSYRCARKIIAEAQKIVPEIMPAPDAEEGAVWDDGSLTELREGDWILCKNLRPLVATWLWLTKNKIKSVIRGRDIGAGIINLIEKTGARSSLEGLRRGLATEEGKLLARLKARGVRHPAVHPKMELFTQRQEVILTLAEEVNNVEELIKLVNSIFSDNTAKKEIILSTIHKSKGLENDRVFFLIPELIPSRFATMDWQLEQEENLRYVATTRARRELIYVHSRQFLEDLKNKVIL